MRTLLAIFAFVSASLCTGVAAQRIAVEGYAATVNERVIMVSEVLELISPVERQLRDMYEGKELAQKLQEAFQSGLQTLIEQALILEDFSRQEKMFIPDKLVDERVNEILHERFNGDQSKFLATLAEQGLELSDWRESIRDRLTIMLLRRAEVLEKVSISPGAVYEAYLDNIDLYKTPAEVQLKTIVLHKGLTPEDAEFKRKEAERTREIISAGEDFESVARETSEDSRADRGGDWGWMKLDDLKQQLRDSISDLKAGEISEVIETEDDFFIVKIEARKDSAITPFEEVKEEIERELERLEQEQVYRTWIDRLRAKYHVKVFHTDET
ncbi:MAG: peptidyl-prolyl cis-trans isomerase [Verrucomicrobia bacterium]|nr:peptidyl-prolyl cis-trans isomerase [Verrucomicrobiota bacterium]